MEFPARDRSNPQEDLLRAAQTGDRGAFDRLMADEASALKDLLRRNLASAGLPAAGVEDAYQDVCLRALGALPTCAFVHYRAFQVWLRTIARNRARSLGRARRRAGQGRSLDTEVGRTETGSILYLGQAKRSAERSPSGWAVLREQRITVEAVLAALPPRHAEVLRLTRFSGLSGPEVAARMGIREDAVRQLLVRALESCRRALVARGLLGREAGR